MKTKQHEKASGRRASWLAWMLGWALVGGADFPGAGPARAAERIPVILDTDIGDDIDDTWALGFLLKCPELDVKLVVGDYGRPQYRARLLAKLLQVMGRTDIPIGVGIEVEKVGGPEAQAGWVKDYALTSYPGKVHADGVGAIIETVRASARPVTLICIGPLPNIASLLERDPAVVKQARFVGMHGSVRKGYGGKAEPDAEWNVRAAPAACQKALSAAWETTITPLDTCGLVTLDGDVYARVRDSKDPVARAIMDNYRVWGVHHKMTPEAVNKASSTLFDTVAVYLAFRQDHCQMETLGIRVTDDGFTRLDDQGKKMKVATAWKDLAGFRTLMAERLTTPVPR